jgi:hypothetical protein
MSRKKRGNKLQSKPEIYPVDFSSILPPNIQKKIKVVGKCNGKITLEVEEVFLKSCMTFM